MRFPVFKGTQEQDFIRVRNSTSRITGPMLIEDFAFSAINPRIFDWIYNTEK
jgi:hypothetical protein